MYIHIGGYQGSFMACIRLPITDLNLATGVPLCSKLTKTIFELLENNSSLFFKNIELFLPQEAAAPKVSNIILQNLKI